VPLAFACRQIVPATIQVGFGPGVDPDTKVTWRGGQPWPNALAAALRPLGLHLTQAGNRIVIRR
jgi:hypothetical protein